MINTTENNIRETVQILKQLDEKNLLLIDSGAKLLFARQKLDIDQGEESQEEKISWATSTTCQSYLVKKTRRYFMKYIYKINGEERFPTEEERKKLYSTFVQALGYRPVVKQEKKPKQGKNWKRKGQSTPRVNYPSWKEY